MSSRKGNILSAFDVLDTVRNTAGPDVSEDTMLSAIKYTFTKNRLGGDIVIDPKEAVSLEGNSGPYMQYAHARARSILAKSHKNAKSPANLDKYERLLLKKIGEYSEIVDLATKELAPHHLNKYLYDLAQNFNRFYENSLVIGGNREAERVWMVERYSQTLKNGLNLLGIKAPERM